MARSLARLLEYVSLGWFATIKRQPHKKLRRLGGAGPWFWGHPNTWPRFAIDAFFGSNPTNLTGTDLWPITDSIAADSGDCPARYAKLLKSSPRRVVKRNHGAVPLDSRAKQPSGLASSMARLGMLTVAAVAIARCATCRTHRRPLFRVRSKRMTSPASRPRAPTASSTRSTSSWQPRTRPPPSLTCSRPWQPPKRRQVSGRACDRYVIV